MKTQFTHTLADICLTSFFSLFMFFPSFGQNLHVEPVGRWAHGFCFGIDLKENIAYHGSGAYLVISDVSDSINPVELDKITFPNYVRAVQIIDDVLFVGDEEEGLFMYDVTNASEPMLLSSVQLNQFNEVARSGTMLYVASSDEFLILDIENPDSPVEIFRNDWRFDQIELDGMVLYTVDQQGDLLRIDISDPGNPEIMESYTDPVHKILCIDLLEDTIYLGNRFGQFVGLEILPSGYNELCRVDFGSRGSDVMVRYPFAYFGATTNGLKVLDVSSIKSPVKLSTTYFSRNTDKLVLWNNYIFVNFGDGGLIQLDIRNPEDPVIVRKWPTGGYPVGFGVKDNLVYKSAGNQGISVIDISDPQNYYRRYVYETDDYSGGVYLKDDILYAAAGTEGMYIFDIGNPDHATIIGQYKPTESEFGLYVTAYENYVYLSAVTRGMLILDISDIDNIVKTATYKTGDNFQEILYDKEMVYILDRSNGFHVVDVSDQNNPVGIKIENNQRYSDFALYEDLLFLTRSGAIDIYQIIDLENTTLFSTFPITYSLTGIELADDKAYVTYPNGLKILDIKDPENIEIIGEYSGFTSATDLIVDDHNIVVSEELTGFRVLRTEVSTSTNDLGFEDKTTLNIWPNPFVSDCSVIYNLTDPQWVSLCLYNPEGKLLKTLVNRKQGPGEYQIRFAPENHTGGLFFVVLKTGSKTVTKKLINLPGMDY